MFSMDSTMDSNAPFIQDETVGTVTPPDADPHQPPPSLDVDAEEGEVALLSAAERRARWQSRRPPVAHLRPGTVVAPGGDRLPLFDVGDRIVVDCCTRLLPGNPWLETVVGRVVAIDDDVGIVRLVDEDVDARMSRARVVSLRDDVFDFRLAPATGSPFTVTAVRAASRAATGSASSSTSTDPAGKRGRGRPKGAKNRSKAEIEAEREAYRKLREEKRARRGKR